MTATLWLAAAYGCWLGFFTGLALARLFRRRKLLNRQAWRRIHKLRRMSHHITTWDYAPPVIELRDPRRWVTWSGKN